MANEKEFTAQILTPARRLLNAKVSEVVLPADDGEVGVLAGHQDFIGQLGTGIMKVVRGGDDYWFMVSSGVFEVSAGELRIIAEVGEDANEIEAEAAREKLKQLELSPVENTGPEAAFHLLSIERAKARLEARRRTELN